MKDENVVLKKLRRVDVNRRQDNKIDILSVGPSSQRIRELCGLRVVVPQGGAEATPLIVKLFMVFMCSQAFAEFCFFRDICDSCKRAFDWHALLNIFVPLKIFSIFGKFLHH